MPHHALPSPASSPHVPAPGANLLRPASEPTESAPCQKRTRPVSTRIDRRSLLAAGAAALGATLTPSPFSQAEPAGNDEFGGFQVGVQSFCWHRFPIERMLRDVQELGLRYVELFPGHAPIESPPAEIERIVGLCTDHNVQPIAIGVLNFSRDHDANKRIFEYAARLGVRSIGADPAWDSFDSLDQLVEEYKIPVAIHPHGPVGRQLHPWHRAEIILDHVKHHHELIGTCLDTGHLIRCAAPPFHITIDPSRQIRLMGARNFGIHFKDHDNKLNKNVVLGKGALDVRETLLALKEVKFDRLISIEHEAHPEDPVPEIREGIAIFQQTANTL